MIKLATKLKNQGMKDVASTILKDTRHETLNEINRDQTTTDFIEWLNERF